MNNKAEWVEMIQPETNKLMYTNIKTGECTWDQPQDSVSIKRLNDQSHQWWELFDVNSSRFYYYNVNTLESKWQKPKEKGVTVIPLAKLQILKPNTLINSNQVKKDVSTQTSNSLSYFADASTQTSLQTLPRFSHHHGFHSKHHCQSNHAQNHSQISERSLRHYLLSEARFAGLCYNIDSYCDGSDEEYEDEFEGSSDDLAESWDADDEDNNQEEDDCDEESDDGDIISGPRHEHDETDASDYFETSSFVYCLKSGSFTSGLSSTETNERTPIPPYEIGQPLDDRKERKSKDKSNDNRERVEEIRDERDSKRKDVVFKAEEEEDLDEKPIPPKRIVSLDPSLGSTKPQSNEQLEKYARENIKRHLKKGGLNQVLKRRHSLKGMLIWTKSSIKQPMIATLMNDNDLKQEAINCFKLIQQYCGDRGKGGEKSLNRGGTLVRREEVAKELITKGVVKGLLLRDEIYVQLCRQTTDNPLDESLQLGLELIALCLYYFSPSHKFTPYLSSFLNTHKSEFARKVCLKKLEIKMENVSYSGNSVGGHCRRPASVQEVAMVTNALKRGFLGMFGESLANLMPLQAIYLPKRKLPWIQVTLSETILRLGGAEQEGIFRIAGDVEETTMLKLYIDCIQMDKELESDFLVLCNRWRGVSGNERDANLDVNLFACLLKQWFRELREPVIPYDLYYEALNSCESPSNAVFLVEKKLPVINKLVIGYLIRFLQVFSAKQNVDNTKMDENNLSMVWAPNILRAPANSSNYPENPSIIFENTRKEMTFIRTLIQYLDTSYIEGVL